MPYFFRFQCESCTIIHEWEHCKILPDVESMSHYIYDNGNDGLFALSKERQWPYLTFDVCAVKTRAIVHLNLLMSLRQLHLAIRKINLGTLFVTAVISFAHQANITEKKKVLKIINFNYLNNNIDNLYKHINIF